MLSVKIKEYLNEYISQEVYVQVAVAKGKNKITTNAAINKYFESNLDKIFLWSLITQIYLNLIYKYNFEEKL